ncbi:HAD-IC family P-type ATPase [Marinilactibacillus kalidii]|uniref:HAD-IC family P-type ATPase n=1 Tax=Marinilactibacillus kalidii TaxID=2820274 RepID=UPI001ABEA60F|nr:HAD-IC family P-type ATPase [Marinilactibacillus kalidii]
MTKKSNYPGLSYAEVETRKVRGESNEALPPMTRSFRQIFLENSLTLFNLINIIIAGFVIYTGSYKNLLFLGVILVNTAVGVFQELRAKKNIDELTLLNQAKATVIRNGQQEEILQEEIVKNDLLVIKRGQQIVVDGTVIQTTGIECDESQLTGEVDPILKQAGDAVYSGSFVVSGQALLEATKVGKESYSSKLTLEAKGEKSIYSELLQTMKKVIRILTFGIIPIGTALFMSSLLSDMSVNQAILGSTAAMIGMIPEGLILLTTVALAVGVIRLSRKKVLVKTMGSIETLARVDILCLDKTGTLTSGELKVLQTNITGGWSERTFEEMVGRFAHDLNEDNATGLALMDAFPKAKDSWIMAKTIPFSSVRKWSAVEYEQKGTIVMGAPEYLFDAFTPELTENLHLATKEGLRVLAIATSKAQLVGQDLPVALKLEGIIVLEDEIRENAPQTLQYFKEQAVEICIISGDHPQTVAHIAKRAGVEDSDKLVDMSQLEEPIDYPSLTREHRIFGRVSPEQKRALVEAFQANGRTVGMTGDGVNDILALKKADCSIVMANGSDATKGIADFVLLDSNFDSMVGVVLEGRKVVNNIQRVASLYLTKTVYSILLAALFIFISSPYPFQPIQLSPISTLIVGIPSFFLALRPNVEPIKGRFFQNILEPALASGLSVVLFTLTILFFGTRMNWTYEETSTITVWMTGIVCFVVLYHISKPSNWKILLMIGTLLGCFIILFLFFGKVFSLVSLFQWHLALVYVPLMLAVVPLFYSLKQIMHLLLGNHRQVSETAIH